MTDDLRARVERLEARAAILDCIARHARGCDRHDIDLITTTYHDDGIDEHGAAVNRGPEYGAWANSVHGATSANHLHHLTTHTCSVEGNTAHAESYVLVMLLAPDERSVTVMAGRYVDRLERRAGEWRIAVRRATCELAFTADARLLQSEFFRDQAYVLGQRNHGDLSYARPLEPLTPAARWSDAT